MEGIRNKAASHKYRAHTHAELRDAYHHVFHGGRVVLFFSHAAFLLCATLKQKRREDDIFVTSSTVHYRSSTLHMYDDVKDHPFTFGALCAQG